MLYAGKSVKWPASLYDNCKAPMFQFYIQIGFLWLLNFYKNVGRLFVSVAVAGSEFWQNDLGVSDDGKSVNDHHANAVVVLSQCYHMAPMFQYGKHISPLLNGSL